MVGSALTNPMKEKQYNVYHLLGTIGFVLSNKFCFKYLEHFSFVCGLLLMLGQNDPTPMADL